MTGPVFWHMGGGIYTVAAGRAEIVPIEDARELAADLGRYALSEADPARKAAIARTAVSLYAAMEQRARWMRCAGWSPEAIGQGGAGESHRRDYSLPPLATGRYWGARPVTVDPNPTAPESFQAESCFPPPPTVVPLATAAMDKFLARPVRLYGLTARQVLRAVVTEHIEATRDRRTLIEGMLERLADLRDSLVVKLDALDADPDLEPFLSAFDRMDQCQWSKGAGDDRELDDDREPYLSATNHIDQRHWSLGGASDLEWEHDGREPEEAP